LLFFSKKRKKNKKNKKMTVAIPYSLVRYLLELDRANHLDVVNLGEDEARLESVVGVSPEQRSGFPNLALYGPLSESKPKEKLRYANEVVIYNGSLIIANHCEIADLGYSTQRPCLIISSTTVSAALKKFVADGRPRRGFQPNPSPAELSLVALRDALDYIGADTLRDVPGLINTSFVINGDFHWSAVVYNAQDNGCMYWDSLGNVHERTAVDLLALLKSTGLLPSDANLFKLPEAALQRGSWQCGYAVLVFLTHEGGMLEGEDPCKIIVDDKRLAGFIAGLLVESRHRRASEEQSTRHWYKLK
jgi:hypothetical protein